MKRYISQAPDTMPWAVQPGSCFSEPPQEVSGIWLSLLKVLCDSHCPRDPQPSTQDPTRCLFRFLSRDPSGSLPKIPKMGQEFSCSCDCGYVYVFHMKSLLGTLRELLVSSVIFNIVSYRKASILLDVAPRADARMLLWASPSSSLAQSISLSILLAKECFEGSGDFNASLSSGPRGLWTSLRTRGTQLAFLSDTGNFLFALSTF